MIEIEPFSPADARKFKVTSTPLEVIQAANELLAENYIDGQIHIKLKDLKARCRKILGVDDPMFSGVDPMSNWSSKVWDIEEVYRQRGWKVVYDKPAYNESYDSYFIFIPKDESQCRNRSSGRL
jgi:hypothetical protein